MPEINPAAINTSSIFFIAYSPTIQPDQPDAVATPTIKIMRAPIANNANKAQVKPAARRDN